MMPVQVDMATQPISQSPGAAQQSGPSIAGEHVNYKKKYKALKRKMRMLVYEQECFGEELKKAQRKLLKVSRDRSFLLDRLLNYEKLDDSSDDTDATASSDSDGDGKEPLTKKRKVPNQAPLSLSGAGISLLPGNLNKQQASWLLQMSGAADKAGRGDGSTKRKTTKVSRKSAKSASQDSGTGSGSSATGQMTREELERHLELKQSAKPQYMSVEKTPYSLPDDIFCNDNSNQDGEALEVKKEDLSVLSQFLHMPR